jgi:hypothetical protein
MAECIYRNTMDVCIYRNTMANPGQAWVYIYARYLWVRVVLFNPGYYICVVHVGTFGSGQLWELCVYICIWMYVCIYTRVCDLIILRRKLVQARPIEVPAVSMGIIAAASRRSLKAFWKEKGKQWEVTLLVCMHMTCFLWVTLWLCVHKCSQGEA